MGPDFRWVCVSCPMFVWLLTSRLVCVLSCSMSVWLMAQVFPTMEWALAGALTTALAVEQLLVRGVAYGFGGR